MTKRIVACIVALLFVAFLFVALTGYRAAAKAADPQRESEDRVQIERLMWHYIRALDTGNGDAYAATFTSDGQFGTGAKAVKGHEALKKMIDDYRQRVADAEAKSGQKRPPMYHVIANSDLEFVDKDHAHLEAYWMTVVAQGGPTVPSRIAGAGREVDELVRQNGQWLIKTRDVAPTD